MKLRQYATIRTPYPHYLKHGPQVFRAISPAHQYLLRTVIYHKSDPKCVRFSQFGHKEKVRYAKYFENRGALSVARLEFTIVGRLRQATPKCISTSLFRYNAYDAYNRLHCPWTVTRLKGLPQPYLMLTFLGIHTVIDGTCTAETRSTCNLGLLLRL